MELLRFLISWVQGLKFLFNNVFRRFPRLKFKFCKYLGHNRLKNIEKIGGPSQDRRERAKCDDTEKMKKIVWRMGGGGAKRWGGGRKKRITTG